MKKQMLRGLFIAVVLVAGLGSGCGKKAETDAGAGAAAPAAGEAGPVSASNLEGANDVLALIDKKEYEAGIAKFVQLKQSLPPGELQGKFGILADEVRIRLIDNAPGDPKAAQALAVYRQLMGGR